MPLPHLDFTLDHGQTFTGLYLYEMRTLVLKLEASSAAWNLQMFISMVFVYDIFSSNVLEVSHEKALHFEIWSRISFGEGTKIQKACLLTCREMSKDTELWQQFEPLSCHIKIKALKRQQQELNELNTKKSQSH